ncbi:MAG: methyltransferase domain-containing protein [Bryobacterales bacterium]|nr:methyltransferase domain-containing protein [Bryobacterales bacterium]
MTQQHQSDPRILNRRSVERDHRGLLDHLRAGMHVLDIGCGTGSITAGIARLVTPDGTVTGIDRDASLLDIACREHADIPGLCFEQHDILSLPYQSHFDIVTAARVVQWIDDPPAALRNMKSAARSGGLVVVLDYNHVENLWEPEPPPPFRAFYKAFLDWRASNRWSNQIAAELPSLFRDAGIEVLRIENSDEVTVRGEPGFHQAASIWADVAESLGPNIVAQGYLTEAQREEAARVYREWVADGLEQQILCLRTVSGTVRS